MRILFSFVCLLFVSNSITAQQEESTSKYVIGGSTNFMYQNNTYPFSALTILSGIGSIYSISIADSKNMTLAFASYIGKQLSENWLGGIELEYRYGKYKAENVYDFITQGNILLERISNQYTLGLFGRYTLNPQHKLGVFLRPSTQYSTLNEIEKHDGIEYQKEKAYYITVNLGLGAVYQISERIQAVGRFGGLSYVDGNWKIEDTETEKDFSSFSFSLNATTVYFGLEITL